MCQDICKNTVQITETPISDVDFPNLGLQQNCSRINFAPDSKWYPLINWVCK